MRIGRDAGTGRFVPIRTTITRPRVNLCPAVAEPDRFTLNHVVYLALHNREVCRWVRHLPPMPTVIVAGSTRENGNRSEDVTAWVQVF